MREPHEADGLLDMLIEWVGEVDMRKFCAAAKVFFRVGPPVVPFLIQAAVKPETGVEHQRRLLDLAQRIGGWVGPIDRSRLRALCLRGSPAIRAKARQVLDTLSAYGPAPKQRLRMSEIRRAVRGWQDDMRALAAARRAREKTGRGSVRSRVPAGGTPAARAARL